MFGSGGGSAGRERRSRDGSSSSNNSSNSREVHVIVDEYQDVLNKLLSHDCAELRSGLIEDCRNEQPMLQMLNAARHCRSLRSLYAVLDVEMTNEVWRAVAQVLNANRSLDKLWIWTTTTAATGNNRPRTDAVASFFQQATPVTITDDAHKDDDDDVDNADNKQKRRILEGLGMELMEPTRPFQSLERRTIEEFFRREPMLIVNIMCEVRTRTLNVGNSSFLDCVLTGLGLSTTVRHLIVRHSNMDPEQCRIQLSGESIEYFLSRNTSVHTFAVLIGSCVDVATSLGIALRHNRFNRNLSIHNANHEATRGFLSGLDQAQRVHTLALVDCNLCLQSLVRGVQSCRSINCLDIQDTQQSWTPQFLDELLQALTPALINNKSIRRLEITSESAELSDVGVSALMELLQQKHKWKRIEIKVNRVQGVKLPHHNSLVLHQSSSDAAARVSSPNDFFQISEGCENNRKKHKAEGRHA